LDPATQAQVIAADGTVLAATRGLVGVPATFALPVGSTTPIRLKGADGVIPDDVHVYANRDTVRGVLIVAATPTGLLRDINSEFTYRLLLGFPIILVLAALAVWILVGRALGPVERIRNAANAITSADLSRRVPEPGTDDEIGHLAQTMNEMLARLEDAARRQRTFVADASHELRSPVAAIRTTLDVALAHPDTAPWPVIAARAAQQGERLELLLQQLLLLAKADEHTLAGHRVPVDVGELLHEVTRTTRTDHVTVELAPAGDASVLGNPGNLARLFRNLLDNAVRYAANTVTITTDSTPTTVEIHIVDDGPGVPEADRERVFDRFVRLDSSRDRATGNSGLGLAIAREIATSHHGSIWIEDGPGAHVVVRLPRPHD
jgi:signal transduction histidine kinase